MITLDLQTILAVIAVFLLFILVLCLCLSGVLWQIMMLRKKLEEKEKEVISQDLLQTELKNELDKLTNRYLEEYNQIGQNQSKVIEEELGKLRQNTLNNLQNVSKDIENQIKDNLQKDYQQMLGEINKQKELRLGELDSEINIVSKKVIEEVLGRSISEEDHEKLVMEALEKAKKQGIFKH